MAGDQVVFLFDVDNTLLDNDRVVADLMRHLEREVGHERQQRYWTIFEQLRSQLGYADYLGALQRYRLENPRDSRLLAVSLFLIDYRFANRLFPNSLDVLERCRQWGPTVILSDGDVVFQPHKVEASGLFEAVEGRVLIYVHKELELDDVEQKYPADHYVVVDDKLRILTAIKNAWGNRDDGVSAPGTLCARRGSDRQVSGRRHHYRADRRADGLRSRGAARRAS